MAESIFTKECNTLSSNAITGGMNAQHHLYYPLKESIKHAQQIDLIVSFLMESGVRMILPELKEAIKRGVRIRILTGRYLGITQPSAIYLLKQELGNQVQMKFYNDTSHSFHPKSYMFYHDEEIELYIGSSNVSKSALTSGIEWNYRFTSKQDQQTIKEFITVFEDLFEHHSVVISDELLRQYSNSRCTSGVSRELEHSIVEYSPVEEIHPRGVQVEALYYLNLTRLEGAKRALIQAATGVGKTYLAAFDSLKYKRVLFVAHREEILKQAATSFQKVRNSDDVGFFNKDEKNTQASMIFASVSTLSKAQYLQDEYFDRDAFDYIVIDEFHHSVNQSYLNIIDYFKPSFLLGLTATPERMDGKDVYEICDYNVPYEIDVKTAINRGILVPFHYYGIYDSFDYTTIPIVNGKYEEVELTNAYVENQKRVELIYKQYRKYCSKKALGFCCSKLHAKFMCEEFCKRGIKAVCVYSGADSNYAMDRHVAIKQLEQGMVSIIFCVDMFNEGVDIPSIDMVLFLRPTQSPTIFLQQLGRGLRKYKGKRYVTVLDFIGNYNKAYESKYWLIGKNNTKDGEWEGEDVYPIDCIVDYDLEVIDLFEEMKRNMIPFKERIDQEFYRIKEELGMVPTRMQLFLGMDEQVYQYCISHAKQNPFRNYLHYLKELKECNEEELQMIDSEAYDFLVMLEQTQMQKVYKMPILYSFYNDGNLKMEVSEEEILQHWKMFFSHETNWKDLGMVDTYEEFLRMSDQEHIRKAKDMPVRFLLKSSNGLFQKKEGCVLALKESLRPWIGKDVVKKHMLDIIKYRSSEYYRRRYLEKKEV